MKKIGLSLLFSIFLLGIFASAAFATLAGDQDPVGGYNDGMEVPDGFPASLFNANNTGDEEDPIRAVAGHRTHGDYGYNTNSCASCHQTHTAATDSKLLFADNTYQTCVACHDGTLGFYNVFETGENASLDGAGTFAGSHSASVHMANDTVMIRTAPGGKPGGGNEWNTAFNCASCHSPHGSYSDRLLHNNPNGFATSPQVTAGSNTFGNYLDIPIHSDDPTTNNVQYLKRTTVDGMVKIDLWETFNAGTNQSPNIQARKVNSPWLYGYAGRTSPHFTRVYKGTDNQLVNGENGVWYGNDDVYVNFDKGYFLAQTPEGNNLLNEMTNGKVAIPYIVKMDLVVDTEQSIPGGPTIYRTNQAAYWDGFVVPENRRAEFTAAGFSVNATTFRTSNLGVEMSKYCATCHTDYSTSRSNSGDSYWGAETAAQRHSTNSDRFSCVRCHFAHGTDVEIMMDAMGNTVADLEASTDMSHTDAVNYMADNNPSSALKKFTNMSSCFACHNSSRATPFKNSPSDQERPTGMPESSDGVQR